MNKQFVLLSLLRIGFGLLGTLLGLALLAN